MIVTQPFKYAEFLGYVKKSELSISNSQEYYVLTTNKSIVDAFIGNKIKERMFSDTFIYMNKDRTLHISKGFIYDYDLFYVVKAEGNTVNMHPRFIANHNSIAKLIKKQYDVKVTANVLSGCVYEYNDEDILYIQESIVNAIERTISSYDTFYRFYNQALLSIKQTDNEKTES